MTQELGGFPYSCWDSIECNQDAECVLLGCKRGYGTPPRGHEGKNYVVDSGTVMYGSSDNRNWTPVVASISLSGMDHVAFSQQANMGHITTAVPTSIIRENRKQRRKREAMNRNK